VRHVLRKNRKKNHNQLMDILFDIGRVLLNFDFQASMRQVFANETQDSIERLMEELENRNDFESGRENADDFIKRLIESLDSNTKASSCEMLAAWQGVFTRNEAMWEVVARLWHDGGHRMILFSNTNEIHASWFFREFPEFEMFDGAVLSHRVGAMKPAAAIYEYAIREFGLDPRRTRYVDDLPENVAAGVGFGFHCHLYDPSRHDRFERWLDGQLGN